MTPRERHLRAWGLSLLVHGVLVGMAWWLWSRPPPKPKPEPVPWDVGLLEPAPVPARATVDRLPPPPDSAAPPAEPALAPPPPATAGGPAPSPSAMPAFAPPRSAAPLVAGQVAFPVAPGLVGAAGTPGVGGAYGAGAVARPAAPEAPGSPLAALVRIPPAYPMEARRRKLEGWVRLEFTVTEDGAVTEVAVKGAEPAGVFDQAAAEAIARWKFRPAVENGKPARKRAAQTLKFELHP